MNVKELRKDLRSGPHLINLIGREEFFKSQAKKTIAEVLINSGTEDFNLSEIREDKPTADQMTDLQQEPFDSEYKVVFFFGSDTTECLRYKGSNTVFVSMNGRLSSPELEVDCKRLSGKRLKAWVRVNAKSRGLLLDKEDLYDLVSTFGADIALLTGQLEKLSLLDHAQGEHVKALCCDFQGYSVWDLINAIFLKDSGAAVDSLSALRVSGLSELQIMSAVQRQYRMLARQEAGIDLALELSDVEVQRFLRMKGKLDAELLLKILRALTEVEWDLKTGSGSERLTIFVFNLSRGRL